MTLRSTIRRAMLSSFVALCLAASASPAAAQRRARLSADLADRMSRNAQDIDVIVHGTQAELDALAARYNLRVKRYLRSGGVLRVNAGQLSALQGDAGVSHLSSDAPVRSAADVTRETIGADQVWAGAGALKALSGAGVTVAVIDSGVDVRHAALANRIVANVDFTGGDGVDRYGHGTHVAALIAGAAGRTADTADYGGIAPGARIVSLRVLDANGAGQASDVMEAIDWAIEHRREFNIKVINLSLGAPVLQSYLDDPLCEAAERATEAGIVVVAAAGNFGLTADGKKVFGGITAPGNAPSVITVGALDTKGTVARSDDTIATFSSRGPTLYDHIIKPDLVAPGRNVVSAEAAGSLLATQFPERHVTGSGRTGYIQLSGSSMSAGVVSGVVALLLERRPRLGPAEMRMTLQATSTFMPSEGLVASGAGSLNALTALVFVGDRRSDPPSIAIAGESALAGGLFTLLKGTDQSRPLVGNQLERKSGAVLGSTIVWGSSALRAETIVWSGANVLDTIVWGSGTQETIVWGSGVSDTIVWGSGALDTIVWGSVAAGTIVWGSCIGSGETIVWGSRSQDTIVWGSGGADTIIWSISQADTIVWGSGLSNDSTIVWGSANLT